MLTFSSTASLPQGSSPVTKRDRPHDDGSARPKPRISAPFVDDDDDEDDEEEIGHKDARPDAEPSPKRRMLEHPKENEENSHTSDKQETGPEANDAREKTHLEAVDSGLNGTSGRGNPQSSVPAWSTQRPLFSTSLLSSLVPSSYSVGTCNGKISTIKERKTATAVSYESMVASRSKTKEGRAQRSYYGIDIHNLIDAASKEIAAKRPEEEASGRLPLQSVETAPATGKKSKKHLLWTEKYRARNFLDLCGDDSTNRVVLRWLKRWDTLVFPGAVKSKPVIAKRPGMARKEPEEEKPHRKILMLTGPPGLGKTTLAHVCAKQAGYEVMEVNASDDRSRDVVKNRIRTSLGTETVKTVSNRRDGDAPRKPAKPVCVVVDEVDGVVAGSGGSGEGGFVKALIDLVLLDQRNATSGATSSSATTGRKKKKGDDFRLMRPLILICNDVYHPSLRPLRQSNLAEIIHVGRPSIDAVVGRLKAVFDKEAIPCDKDAARKLCEAAWGMSSGADAKRGLGSTVEGDLRGVMVVGEWVAGRFRASNLGANERLTRQWIEQNVLHDLSNGAAGARGIGRGNVRDIVSRLFQEGGGFPKQAMNVSETTKNKHEQPKAELGFGEQQKKHAMERLREMVDTSGEISHVLTEVFAEYPNRDFNDDCYLTKPNQAYDWLHFHDSCQSRLYTSQEWELAPYLSQPVLACHHLFASPKKYHDIDYNKHRNADADGEADTPPLPFSGPRADYQAYEAEKQNRAQLQAIQAQLTPTLTRSFRSVEDVSSELLPYLTRMVSPDVKPVVVGGSQGGSTAAVRKESEKAMVRRAAEVLAEVGIALHKGKIESDSLASRGPQFVYRMEPYVQIPFLPSFFHPYIYIIGRMLIPRAETSTHCPLLRQQHPSSLRKHQRATPSARSSTRSCSARSLSARPRPVRPASEKAGRQRQLMHPAPH